MTKLRIRELCKERGITQADLAAKLGIRRDSLSQAISRNNFDLDYLRRISAALNVEIWQLFIAETTAAPTFTCPHCGKVINVQIGK